MWEAVRQPIELLVSLSVSLLVGVSSTAALFPKLAFLGGHHSIQDFSVQISSPALSTY